jgi:NADPH:quinone reductase-like Zn-dependent oxidoreductase
MRAIVVHEPGPPEVLRLEERPIPEPRPGWALIEVRAFGLNRSEMFTRQGHSPGVEFPRVLGIECSGVVVAAPQTDLAAGQTVVAVMGQMGRAYDGGYAEYALIPATQVMPVRTELPWETLAALPETFLTAWEALFDALDLQPGQTLLIRGGTSALGMAAANLATRHGVTVIATTRQEHKRASLLDNGASQVVIDSGQIAPAVRALYPAGVDAVLELVGTVTLLDSLQLVRPRGCVCFAGILGNAWALDRFEPFSIPSTVRLTSYSSEGITAAGAAPAMQAIVDGVAAGHYRVNLVRVFAMVEIVAAHRYMESNQATGKLVVRTG